MDSFELAAAFFARGLLPLRKTNSNFISNAISKNESCRERFCCAHRFFVQFWFWFGLFFAVFHSIFSHEAWFLYNVKTENLSCTKDKEIWEKNPRKVPNIATLGSDVIWLRSILKSFSTSMLYTTKETTKISEFQE